MADSNEKLIFELGEASLSVMGYQFPESTDEYDANWLVMAVDFPIAGGRTRAVNPCLQTQDLSQWVEQLEALHAGELAEARITPLEPYLEMSVERLDDTSFRARLAYRKVVFEAWLCEEVEAVDQDWVKAVAANGRLASAAYPFRMSSNDPE